MVFFSDPPSNPFKLKPWLTQFKNGVLTGNFTFGSSVAANTVYAGPTGGGDANPTFRALVDADIPTLSLDASEIVSGTINDDRIDWASPPDIGFGTQSNGRFSSLRSESLTGDTFLTIDGNAFDNKYLRFSSDSDFINPGRQFDARWSWSVEDDDLGSNQGSNLYLKSWSDAGASYTVASFNRAAGGTGEIEWNNQTRFNQDVEFNEPVTFQLGTSPIFVGAVDFQNTALFSNGNVTIDNGFDLVMVGGDITGLGSLTAEELYITGGLANVEITNGALNMSSSSITFTGTTSISGLTDLEVTGNITNGAGSVTVDDAFVVTGTSDLRGAISNSTGNVTISDSVDVTGTVAITGNLTVTGTISDPGGNVSINDNTDITGTLTTTGLITGVGVRVDGDPGSGSAGTVTFTDHIGTTPSNTATPSGWFRVYFATNTRYVPVYT